MDPISDIAIPALTVFVMVVVGLELSTEDFRWVMREPRKLLIATATQALLLPLVAFGVIAWLDPPLHHTVGLLVIAGCPGGAFSNFFTALARGEVALSVALTTTCTLVAVVSLPVVTTVGFALFVESPEAVRPPVLQMFGQLVVLLVLPVTFGMLIRHSVGERTAFWQRRLRRIGVAALIALIAWIFVDRASTLADEMAPSFVTASLFLLPAMALGEILGRLLRVSPGERLAYVVEHGFRNLGLAVVVTVTLLRQPGFLAFATVFFVTACLYSLVAVAAFRFRRPA